MRFTSLGLWVACYRLQEFMEITDIFHNYLSIALAKRASDVYFIAGQAPVGKVEGNLENLAHEEIDPRALAEFVFNILPEAMRDQVAQGREADIIHSALNNRFRINIHLQQGMFALAIRIVSNEIPTPQFLNFHPTIYKFSQLKKGLVLLTGSTASGKSSVIASIINMINQEKRAHVITIEDPIEFVYPKKMAVIEQRQIGLDSHSFADALRAAFRQDPDIIMVGEMRDLETIATALTAAVSRELLQRKGGGARVASWEIMVNTSAVASLIRENRLASIFSAMQIGAKDGMTTMEQSKIELRQKGLII